MHLYENITIFDPARTDEEINATVDCTIVLDDNTKALLTGAEAHSTYSLAWAVVDAQSNRVCYSIPAAKIMNDISLGDADNRYVIPLQFKSHDPGNDSGSEYVSAGFNHELAMFHVPV